MAETRPGTIRRALVATLALYALVVAGFVSGLSPALAVSSEFGAICGHASGPDGPPQTPLDHRACCVLACAAAAHGGFVSLPAGAHAIAWSERDGDAIAWAILSFPRDTASVAIRLNARGPPAI